MGVSESRKPVPQSERQLVVWHGPSVQMARLLPDVREQTCSRADLQTIPGWSPRRWRLRRSQRWRTAAVVLTASLTVSWVGDTVGRRFCHLKMYVCALRVQQHFWTSSEEIYNEIAWRSAQYMLPRWCTYLVVFVCYNLCMGEFERSRRSSPCFVQVCEWQK